MRMIWRLAAAAALSAGVLNCSSPQTVDAGAEGGLGDVSIDSTMDARADVMSGDVPVMCATGFTECGGRCVDVLADPLNCGMCGRGCPAGQVCATGACAPSCAADQTNCGGRCISTATDNANCGSCGNVCGAGLVCAAGRCALTCGAMLAMCSSGDDAGTDASSSAYCANLETDRGNCGACGNVCPSGNICVGRSCVLSCVAGQTACSGACVNTNADFANCGSCGNACASGEVCSSGVCTASCGTGNTNCGGACVSTATNPSHCGACSAVCALANVGTQACVGGACIVGACSAGFSDCDRVATNGCETNIRSADVNNCGGCGIRCNFANAGATCAAGVCGMGTCAAGFADCDGSAANGCEVNITTDNANCGACSAAGASRACPSGQVCSTGTCSATCGAGTTNCSGDCVRTTTDVNNCGACGTACALANVGVQACSGSACVVGACTTGFGDCDGSATNGCEANVRGTDVNNCGGCGIRCNFANAGATCAAGVCGMGSCAAGFADCDGVASNGCEVDTRSNNGNCGTCGTACTAGRVCSSSVCSLSCDTGATNCSGACVRIATDVNHCGACGAACALANVSVQACAGSACVVGACATGFGDCDSNATNGCEANIRGTDVNNCGGCGIRCNFANAGATCAAGVCGIGMCAPGFADCDGVPSNGCETDVRTANNNCGACGAVCGAGTACTSGACSATCPGTQTLCGSGMAAVCSNTQIDNNNCGTCGNVCGAGTSCAMGMCRPTCGAGQTSCSGTCANLSNDPAHCGTCTTVCPAGQGCSAGVCRAFGCPPNSVCLAGTPTPSTVFNTIEATYFFSNNLVNTVWHRTANRILSGHFSNNGYYSFAGNTGGYSAFPSVDTGSPYARMVHVPAANAVFRTDQAQFASNASRIYVGNVDNAGVLSGFRAVVFSDGFAGLCNLISASATEFLCYDGANVRRYNVTVGSNVLTFVANVPVAVPSGGVCGSFCFGGTFAWDGMFYYFANVGNSSGSTGYSAFTSSGALVGSFTATGGGGITSTYFDWSVGRYTTHDGFGQRTGGTTFTWAGGFNGDDSQSYGPVSATHAP